MKREASEYKDNLTNEQLLKRFKNQFELVRYAIQLAENRVLSGTETELPSDSQNVAFQVLAEIAANKEIFSEVPVLPQQAAPKQIDSKDTSWSAEVKAFKEDKKEKRTKQKSAR